MPEFYVSVGIVALCVIIVILVVTRRRSGRKLELEALLLSRRQDFSEMSGEWQWETDAAFRFTYISDRFVELSGIPSNILIGKSRHDLAGDSAISKVWRAHLDDIENHRMFQNFEYSSLSPDGKVLHFRFSGKPVFDHDGVFKGYRGVGSEVTEVSNTLAALQESEEQFRHAFENAPVGMALITPEGNRFKVNQAFADFLGYTLEELSNTEMATTNADSATLDESMRLRQRVLDGEISTYKNRRSYRHKNGHTVHGEVTGTLYRNESGEPEYFVAHTVDITDQMNAEVALAQSEARFKAFFDNAPLSLNVKDLEGRFVAVNKFYEAWRGQPENMILGRTADELGEKLVDIVEYKDADKIVMETNAAYEFDAKTMKPDGVIHERAVTKFPIHGPDGAIVSIGAFASDITDLKQNSALLETLLDAAPFTISFRDAEGRFVFVNKKMIEKWGGRAEDYIGKSTEEVFGGMDDLLIGQLVVDVLKSKEPVLDREVSPLNTPGETFIFNVIPVFHEGNEFHGVVVVGQNITALRTMEATLSESESRFSAMMESSPSAILIKDVQGRYVQANRNWHEWFNPDGFDISGKMVFDIFPDVYARKVQENDRAVVEKGLLIQSEMETPLSDNRILTTLLQKFPIKGANDEVIAIGAIYTDISELKKTEEALQERERQLRTITDSLPVLITRLDAKQRFLFVNKTAQKWLQTSADDIIGKPFSDVVPADSYKKLKPHLEKVLSGELTTFEDQLKYPDGVTRHVLVNYIPEFTSDGDVCGILGLSIDQTGRRDAEESSRQLFAAIDALSDAVTLFDSQDKLVFGNKRFREINKAAPETFTPGITFEGQLNAFLAHALIPEAKGREEEWKRDRMSRHRNPKGPFEVLRQDGIWLRVHEQRLPSGVSITLASDITAQKAIQEQLYQSQKMEAIGQLTGGVAHDFNNLLGVIVGNLDFLASELEDGSLLHTLAVRAINAAMRGAELNHHLLAFSRQQTLSPQNINLNDNISDMLELLVRTLGAGIAIESKLARDLWKTHADPAQVESALLNLAVNARDAMPNGGKLIIETANVDLDAEYAKKHVDVAAGAYVMLSVTDTGEGMTPDVQERVFDPFFTTKDVGQGTGLGLSMVFGFVKQSGGHVALYSEVGQGTTVRLYLPRADQGDQKEPETHVEAPIAQGETILLVEDDEELRLVITSMLEKLGYAYRVTENGEGAMSTLAEMPKVELLISDIVLPGGMSGPEIARDVLIRRPDVKVLFISGYPRGALSDKNELDKDVLLLEKPFRISDLAQKIRIALGSS